MSADAPLAAMRAQLIEAMGCVSEDRYCTGWMPGLSQALYEEGGIWQVLGQVTGWPVGTPDHWEWVAWSEAAGLYLTTAP